MKIILSAGIQIAQSEISIEQARGLGLVPYLAFLKVKSAQQLVLREFTGQQGDHDFIQESYYSLSEAIDQFLSVIKREVKSSKNIDIFKAISHSNQTMTYSRDYQVRELNYMLDQIHLRAKEFIKEPHDCFRNKIAGIQSLGALESFKKVLCGESLCSTNSLKDILKILEALRIESYASKKAVTWEVA